MSRLVTILILLCPILFVLGLLIGFFTGQGLLDDSFVKDRDFTIEFSENSSTGLTKVFFEDRCPELLHALNEAAQSQEDDVKKDVDIQIKLHERWTFYYGDPKKKREMGTFTHVKELDFAPLQAEYAKREEFWLPATPTVFYFRKLLIAMQESKTIEISQFESMDQVYDKDSRPLARAEYVPSLGVAPIYCTKIQHLEVTKNPLVPGTPLWLGDSIMRISPDMVQAYFFPLETRR